MLPVDYVDADRIASRLWQGSRPPTGPTLAQRGFDVLVLCAFFQPPAEEFPGVQIIRVPMRDMLAFPRVAFAAGKLVAAHLAVGHRVLVTCEQGINRSGLVSALALWYLTGKPGVDCLWQVQMTRLGALRNKVFARKLFGLPARGRVQPRAQLRRAA